MWVLPPVGMGVSLGSNPPYAVFRNTPSEERDDWSLLT